MTDPELERGVQAQIGRLARSMHREQRGDLDVEGLLLEVTETSVRLLPGVQHAGITLIDGKGGKLHSTAATGPIPRSVDRLQEQHQVGPCVSDPATPHDSRG